MAGEWLKAAIGGEGLSLAAQKGKIVRHWAGPRLPTSSPDLVRGECGDE